jgi:hypothetical protein
LHEQIGTSTATDSGPTSAGLDLDAALRINNITGSSSHRRILEAAASITDAHPIALGDLASVSTATPSPSSSPRSPPPLAARHTTA